MLSEWIAPRSRILDLGCGDGALLCHLARHRRVTGYGLEINPTNVATCIEAGVNVIQADLNLGLSGFEDNSFDTVVMTQALQALKRPDQALAEMLRVGRQAIVTFPNFGHWRARMALLLGIMPITPTLPYHWYDSPNIHLCTVRDFEALCRKRGWRIARRAVLDHAHHEGRFIQIFPNLFCETATYKLGRSS